MQQIYEFDQSKQSVWCWGMIGMYNDTKVNVEILTEPVVYD